MLFWGPVRSLNKVARAEWPLRPDGSASRANEARRNGDREAIGELILRTRDTHGAAGVDVTVPGGYTVFA